MISNGSAAVWVIDGTFMLSHTRTCIHHNKTFTMVGLVCDAFSGNS